MSAWSAFTENYVGIDPRHPVVCPTEIMSESIEIIEGLGDHFFFLCGHSTLLGNPVFDLVKSWTPHLAFITDTHRIDDMRKWLSLSLHTMWKSSDALLKDENKPYNKKAMTTASRAVVWLNLLKEAYGKVGLLSGDHPIHKFFQLDVPPLSWVNPPRNIPVPELDFCLFPDLDHKSESQSE